MIYIKDFIGAKELGIWTIRVMRGRHKDVRLSKEYEAHVEINSLDELRSSDVLKKLVTHQ